MPRKPTTQLKRTRKSPAAPRRKKATFAEPVAEQPAESTLPPVVEERRDFLLPSPRPDSGEVRRSDWILIVSIMILTLFCVWMAWEVHSLSVRTEKAIEWYDSTSKARPAIVVEHDTVRTADLSPVKTPPVQPAPRQGGTSKAESRAYVLIKQCSSFSVKMGEPIVYTIDFLNIGKSTAYNIQTAAEWTIGNGISPDDVKKLRPVRSSPNRVNIKPGQIQTVRFGTEADSQLFSNSDSLSVFGKEKNLYLFGKLIYYDRFGDYHYTRFAFRYNADDQSFLAYERYNDHD